MQRYIDKAPPVETGNVKEDIALVVRYLEYLRNQINFNVAQSNRQNQQKGAE